MVKKRCPARARRANAPPQTPVQTQRAPSQKGAQLTGPSTSNPEASLASMAVVRPPCPTGWVDANPRSSGKDPELTRLCVCVWVWVAMVLPRGAQKQLCPHTAGVGIKK